MWIPPWKKTKNKSGFGFFLTLSHGGDCIHLKFNDGWLCGCIFHSVYYSHMSKDPVLNMHTSNVVNIIVLNKNALWRVIYQVNCVGGRYKVCQLCQQTIWHVLFTTFFLQIPDGWSRVKLREWHGRRKQKWRGDEHKGKMFFLRDSGGKKDPFFFLMCQ